MIKILGIITHGKYSKLIELTEEVIQCPECKYVGSHSDFGVEVRTREFLITCHNCGCEFLVEVK